MSQLQATDTSDAILQIAQEIAALENVEPTDLPPISDSVDPDALSRLVESGDDSLSVKFSYLEYDICVNRDGSTSIIEQE